MGCHDAMGARHVAREEWCDIVVRSAVRKHAPYETIAKGGGVCSETFCPAESVTLEAIGKHREVLPHEPVADSFDFLRSNLDAGRIVKR